MELLPEGDEDFTGIAAPSLRVRVRELPGQQFIDALQNIGRPVALIRLYLN